ncbi:MAG: hypothetical protein QM817_08270 [Archangium sp.]
MVITLMKESSGVRIGKCGPVLICVWFEQATVAGMKLVMDCQRQLVEEFGSTTMLAVAMNLPTRPAPEVSQWLRETNHANDLTINATVVAILARGLGAVIARSFIAALSLFSRQRYTVVKTIEEAVGAVRQLPNQDPSIAAFDGFAQALSDFVETRRAGFAHVG